MLLLRSTDPDRCSSGAPTLYQLQGRRFSGAAVVLLSILLLRSQGHCSSRARGVAPQELGSKVGIAPEEEGVGKENRNLTVNYGLCMVSSMMYAFRSGMVVMKFHMLVFPSVCAIIDYADIFYFVNDLSKA